MTTFALIGAAGYVAPRHMKAIQDIGGQLLAALDPHDSVGILDSFSPECQYFKEPERFDRWLSKNPVDYVVVCSPNYLHDAHSLMALRNGCDVICEKPLTCNERNLDNLAEWEQRTGKKVSAILQCRLHPEAVKVKKLLEREEFYTIKVDYRTSRGQWYDFSWKSDISKSGGLPTNIGVHLFDLCCWFFGEGTAVASDVLEHRATGRVWFDTANLHWLLSIENGTRCRKFYISGICNHFEIDLTTGFTDLHTKSYQEILAGRGFGIEDARPAIRIVEAIRNV